MLHIVLKFQVVHVLTDIQIAFQCPREKKYMAGGRDKEMTNRYEPNTCEATSDRKVARQASVWKETLSKLGQEVGRFS